MLTFRSQCLLRAAHTTSFWTLRFCGG
ncbi:hypothetical protein LINPERPRIM_LOCUS17778 [Linum perenne]